MFTPAFWNTALGLVLIMLALFCNFSLKEIFRTGARNITISGWLLIIVIFSFGFVFCTAGVTLIFGHPVVLRSH